MKLSMRVVALVLAGAAVFACSQSGEDVVTSSSSLARTEGAAGEGSTLDPSRPSEGDARRTVLAEVQSALVHYRESRSAAEAEQIEARFAGTPLSLVRETGTLAPREDRLIDSSVLVEALTLASGQSRSALESSLRGAVDDLVWHAATGAPTAGDARRVDVLTTACSLYDAVEHTDGGVVADGGPPPADAGTGTGTTDGGITFDAGLPPIDLCWTCLQQPQQSESEKLMCKALKLLLKQARRYESEQGDEADVCPPDDCRFQGIGREGFRGSLRVQDLLHGELSGRATYGFECGGGIMEVSAFGSGVFGGDPSYGFSVSWGIRF